MMWEHPSALLHLISESHQFSAGITIAPKAL